MSQEGSRSSNIHSILENIGRRDYLDAAGPLIITAVFAYVLYAIQGPVNFAVIYGVGLNYWPLYELTGLALEQILIATFIASKPEIWERFRNGFFPLLLIAVVVGLFFFGQWFWMIIFAQCLQLIFNPPSEHTRREGCLQAVFIAVLLLIILILAIFSVPQLLSAQFRFPNVSGGLAYLPGMLIIGIGYYFLMAIIAVIRRPVLELLLAENSEKI